VTSLQSSADQTFANQWLERTLDDSANRRLTIPQAFLAVDAVLILFQNITDGLVVYPKTMEKHLNEELPFMATEEILMAGVQAGGDRQILHEQIRVHSQDAARQVKEHGQANDLLERLKNDPSFENVDLSGALDGRRFVGRAPEQVDSFVANVVQRVRDRYAGAAADLSGEVTV
jgi:adenylosuccinate lyase